MTVEINPTGEAFTDGDGKKWLPVLMSFDALSEINKIVLGDKVVKDDSKAIAKRKRVHEDALELMKLLK